MKTHGTLDQFEANVKKLSHIYDPETSKAVATKMVKSGKLSKQEKVVLYEIRVAYNYISRPEDFTAKELSEWSGLDYHLIQRRLSGLCEKGKIRRTGEKRDGCMVWCLV